MTAATRTAIASAETRDGQQGTGQILDTLVMPALFTGASGIKHDVLYHSMRRSQHKVDMPAELLFASEMAAQTASQFADRTAGVNKIAATQREDS